MNYLSFFTQTVTLYHPSVDPNTKEDLFSRIEITGVMAGKKREQTIAANGIATFQDGLQVTVPAEVDAAISVGDLLITGKGQDLAQTYTLVDLRRDHPELCTVMRIVDNRHQMYLKHRKVVGY